MLVPAARHVARSAGHFLLTETTRIDAPPAIADLLRELLAQPTGLPLPPGTGGLSFQLDDAGPPAEGYRMSVTPQGVTVRAHTGAGLRWAVQTLRQLLPPEAYAATPVRGVAWALPAVDIVDGPAYPWRGALLDVARWAHPMPFVRRFVDLMAAHKLNVLHLHLTDDQGWRFEVRRYPRLTEVGGVRAQSPAGHSREQRFDGVRHGGWYTQRELRDLVGYAARRGVRIVPEVDLPGHVQAALAAYPELGNDPARRLPVRTAWGISPHVLNPSAATLDVVRHILDELVDVFPSEIVHIGGDECPTDEWRASPAALARVAELGLPGVCDLQRWYAAELATHLARHGRRVAVWDELLEYGAPADAVVFGWRSQERVAAALAAGHDVVACPHTHTYLDYGETGAEVPGEPVAARLGTPLSKVYGYRPPAPGPGRLLGTQAQLWSEYLPTPALVEYRAFPRLAALAELGWTGFGGDFPDFRRRLAGHLLRLDRARVGYRPPDDVQ
ncbi:beta-N-acetylhexosaminidase [Krasilnikovia sp. MM14-A1004]|uniref:beta-N-acetylhexosaminidase n=1 Tax=Krasilnikovia sp. MM14-A1004 TaxID=3373541 RepID=UPI00399C4B98